MIPRQTAQSCHSCKTSLNRARAISGITSRYFYLGKIFSHRKTAWAFGCDPQASSKRSTARMMPRSSARPFRRPIKE
jgi:hypothetical protein